MRISAVTMQKPGKLAQPCDDEAQEGPTRSRAVGFAWLMMRAARAAEELGNRL